MKIKLCVADSFNELDLPVRSINDPSLAMALLLAFVEDRSNPAAAVSQNENKITLKTERAAVESKLSDEDWELPERLVDRFGKDV